MNKQQTKAYLERIGFTGEIHHTPECLEELILAHISTVPFENLEVSQDHRIPSLEEADIYEKIVVKKRGGWCFEVNKLFYELLKSCGFSVIPVAVRITWMKESLPPYLHRATVATLDGITYLCDVGYGGPGPKGVMKLEEGEYHIRDAVFRIQIPESDVPDEVIVEKFHEGAFFEMMRFQNQRAQEPDFKLMNFFCAKSDECFFKNLDAANLWLRDGSRALLEDTLTLKKNGETIIKECTSPEEKRQWLKAYFGIEKQEERVMKSERMTPGCEKR